MGKTVVSLFCCCVIVTLGVDCAKNSSRLITLKSRRDFWYFKLELEVTTVFKNNYFKYEIYNFTVSAYQEFWKIIFKKIPNNLCFIIFFSKSTDECRKKTSKYQLWSFHSYCTRKIGSKRKMKNARRHSFIRAPVILGSQHYPYIQR